MMKRTLFIKLVPDPGQHTALVRRLETFNAA
jgi:hypothetical protein